MREKIINNYSPQYGNLQRIVWLDWAKAIGIFLVVLGHMRVLHGKPFIYMFHMAFFFMLSGYLYKSQSLHKEIQRSTKSLLIPYLCFNILLLGVAYCVGDYECNMIPKILLCNYELFTVRYFNPLWFLISLFLMRVVCSIVGEKCLLIVGVISLLCSITLYYTGNLPLDKQSDFFQIATTCICFPSYIMGYYIRHLNLLSVPEKIRSVKMRSFILSLLFLALVILGKYNGRVNVFTCAVGHDIMIYYIVSSLLSFLSIYAISKTLNTRRKYIEIISNGTILILAIHVAMIDGMSYGVHMNSMLSVLLGVFIMVISTLLIKMSLRYIPFVLGKSN